MLEAEGATRVREVSQRDIFENIYASRVVLSLASTNNRKQPTAMSKVYKTSVFKIRKPSQRRRAMMLDCMRRASSGFCCR